MGLEQGELVEKRIVALMKLLTNRMGNKRFLLWYNKIN